MQSTFFAKVDLRRDGNLSDVVDQGESGCCYACTSCLAVEHMYRRVTRSDIKLSRQDVFENLIHSDEEDEKGRHLHDAFQWMKVAGCVKEESRRFLETWNVERPLFEDRKVEFYVEWDFITRIDDMEHYLKNIGPIGVTIPFTQEMDHWRGDSIFCDPDPIVNNEAGRHTVLVIGFGTELIDGIDEDYWIIQNSYGLDWGNKGYARFSRNIWTDNDKPLIYYGVVPIMLIVPDPQNQLAPHPGFQTIFIGNKFSFSEKIEQDFKEIAQKIGVLMAREPKRKGEAKETVSKIVRECGASLLVTDMSPLREVKKCKAEICERVSDLVTVHEVDAHNIVPLWVASAKLEYSARTLRGAELMAYIFGTRSGAEVPEVNWCEPGESDAMEVLMGSANGFLPKRLRSYSTDRNHPCKPTALSGLSPYLHFGQISAQICALEAHKLRNSYPQAVDTFLEELIVRRELADNFCYHQPHYDSLQGAWEWARKTLLNHSSDKRKHNYTREQLEKAQTADPLWNASQLEMVHYGKMHGFMRMYWAKKILEWTKGPEEALEICIYLNDKYEMDGRDPSGYVGCMWSICGVHDQGWRERPVFGKVRYMNYEGCKIESHLSTASGLMSLDIHENARSMHPGNSSSSRRGHPDCFIKMAKNLPLTRPNFGKDVRHFEFESVSHAIEYDTGDVLEILPGQDSAAVDAFIQRCNLDPDSFISLNLKTGE